MIEIKAYQCGFCKKYGKSKSNIQKHEKGCYYNPVTKACATCNNLYLHEYKISNSPEFPFGSLIGYIPKCSVGVGISTIADGEKIVKLQNHCLLWTPKEEIDE